MNIKFRSLALAVLFGILTGTLAFAQDAPVPAAYQDLYTSLESQISQVQTQISSGWNGEKSPVAFSAEMLTVNSNSGLNLLGPTVRSKYLQEIQGLKSAGVQAVTFNIAFPLFYQPFFTYNGTPEDYQKFIDFYKQVAADVRAANLKLVVETFELVPGYYSQGSGFNVADYYKTLSLTDLTNGRAQNAIAIIQQIQPDFLLIDSEPDSEAALSGQPALNTVAGNRAFVSSILSQINAAGVRTPAVKIGAGIGSWQTDGGDFVDSLLTTDIDYFDLHVYPVNGNLFANAITFCDKAKAAGKPVAMSEAWLLKARDSELASGSIASNPDIYSRDAFSFWAPLDQQFLTAVSDLANWKGFLYVSPFWSRYFWSYLDYTQYQTVSSDQVTQDSIQAAATAISTVSKFTGTYSAYKGLVNGLNIVSAGGFGYLNLAPDSIVSLFGNNFSSSVISASNFIDLPTTLGNISVSITDSNNATKLIGLYFVSSSQINAVIPAGIPVGTATLSIEIGGTTVTHNTTTLTAVGPSFFTMNQNGKGVPAAFVVTNTSAGQQLRDNAFTCTGGAGTCAPKPINVSAPGSSVALELYGTGIRGRSSLSNVTATIGSTAVPVLYAGPQSQFAGFDQVDLALPPSLAGTGTANLTITVDGVVANTVQIAIQ